MVYIRQRNLPKLNEYKYSGVDNSLVSKYILKPFYTNFVIKCFPMSMAPNAITLSGFGFVIVNFLTLLWYNPTLDQDCPPWVYLTWSVGLFLYQTFDAVDGSQARRTHQSGPLGELFDHGVDALNTSLEVLLFAGAMNLGQTWNTVLTLFGALFTFYIQTWDEYHTHTLTLGVISGPVEGIITLYVVYFITFLKGGGSFWQQPMLSSIGVPKGAMIPDFLYQKAWNEWYIIYGGLVLVFNTCQSAMNVMKARRERGQNPASALLGLLPIMITWILIPAYLALQPVILHHHLIPFVFYAGLINAFSVGQMITRHLVKDKFPYTNILVAPLAWAVFDSLGPKLGLWPSALGDDVYQVAFMFLCMGLSLGVYGSFVHDVITTICDYLDIWCLTIKHPYVENEADGKDLKKSNADAIGLLFSGRASPSSFPYNQFPKRGNDLPRLPTNFLSKVKEIPSMCAESGRHSLSSGGLLSYSFTISGKTSNFVTALNLHRPSTTIYTSKEIPPGGVGVATSSTYSIQARGDPRNKMEQHDESQDAALAKALAEEEMVLATASNIELARKLAERPGFVYQEIAFEQGQQNMAQAKAQQEINDAAQEPAEDQQEEAPLPHCLICDRAEHLSEIDDIGHLCFSCLHHNSGVELEGLAFG